jgi:hypothetical protein
MNGYLRQDQTPVYPIPLTRADLPPRRPYRLLASPRLTGPQTCVFEAGEREAAVLRMASPGFGRELLALGYRYLELAFTLEKI